MSQEIIFEKANKHLLLIEHAYKHFHTYLCIYVNVLCQYLNTVCHLFVFVKILKTSQNNVNITAKFR